MKTSSLIVLVLVLLLAIARTGHLTRALAREGIA